MIDLIKVVIIIFVAARLIDFFVSILLNRVIEKRKHEIERYSKNIWLSRYKNTIPKWFDMTK